MIGIGANLTPGLHHPKMTFDRSALINLCESTGMCIGKKPE